MSESSETTASVFEDELPISVLYVDDYEELCLLAETGLEEASDRIEVESTTDPSSVTNRLGAFDCIVADYEMPKVDGLELLRQVRVLDEEIPFILFTGKGSEDIASDAISLGVTDYLAKGGGQEQFIRLANRIEGAVRARLAESAVEETKSKARATIERERAKFRALVEYSPAVTVVLDERGHYRFATPPVEDMMGYTPRELRGENAFDYIHDDDEERIQREFERTLSNPEYQPTVQYRVQHKNGEWIHVESRGVNRLNDPAVGGFIVNSRDITEQKQTEEKLRRGGASVEKLVDVTPAPTVIVDKEGRIVQANERAAAAVEMQRDDLLGLSPTTPELTVQDSSGGRVSPDECLGPQVIDSGESRYGVEYRIALPSGEFRVVLSASPLTDAPQDLAVISIDEAERP